MSKLIAARIISNNNRPVKKVKKAAHLNHQRALGASLVIASFLAESSASLKYSVCTKLK